MAIKEQTQNSNVFLDTALFRRGKYKVMIIYPDISFRVFHASIKDGYILTIKGFDYYINPKAIARGKKPLLAYYYGNPLPILFKYEGSPITAYDLRSEEEIGKLKKINPDMVTTLKKIPIDSKGINAALHSRYVYNLYYRGFAMNTKFIIIIMVIVLIFIAVILQATGTVDIMGFLQTSTGK